MSHWSKRVCLVTALLFVTPVFAASSIGSGSAVSNGAAAAPASMTKYPFVPIATVQSAGGSGITSTSAGAFTPTDTPKTLMCPGPHKCRVEAVVWASLSNGSTAGNSFGLCGFIDGAIMPQPNNAKFGCPITGTVPADGSTIGATQITADSEVSPGAHTVQFETYTAGTATVDFWVAEYNLSSYDK